jgi:hypothetical protein
MCEVIPADKSYIYNTVNAHAIYETEYDIFNHFNTVTPRPLSPVAFHPCEDFTKGSLLEVSMRTYIKENIRETYGLSYIEYLNLPVDVVLLMREVAAEENAEKMKHLESINKELNKLQRNK